VHDNVRYWMKKYSECVTLLGNVKELLTLYNAGGVHDALQDMLKDIPSADDPPPVPQLFLHIPPPLGSEFKSKKRKHAQSADDVYAAMKSAYSHTASGHQIVPEPAENTKDLDLSDLEQNIKKCHAIISEVDNLTLYNAAHFGMWLEIAFQKFQQDKGSGKILWTNFGVWVKDTCGISDFWAKEMRNFYALARQYPQILCCPLSLSFFKVNRTNILAYFSLNSCAGASWKHPLACTCGKCGPAQ
jgi:hypothetical protein